MASVEPMTVLQSTLELLRARLEAALQVAAPSGEPWVKLTNPVGQDGQVAVGARDKIVMTLVGLETDTSVTSRPAAHPTPAPLNVNISLLFVANFTDSNYPTGLDMLAHVVSFFHATPVFTRALLPGLADGIENFQLEFVNLDLAQTHRLTAMLGIKYLPMALYKLRTLPFGSDAATPRRRPPG
jgi:hypothetical protein